VKFLLSNVLPPVENWLDRPTLWLLGLVLLFLAVTYVILVILRRQSDASVNPAIVDMLSQRVRAWWMMCAILVASFQLGYAASMVLFGFVSFWALREYITMTPTRRGDHRTLFWVFFVFTPLQYVLVGRYHPSFMLAIPVFASLFIPIRIAFAGDHKRFLERSAKIQAGLLICVYSLSYAPALLHMDLWTLDVATEEWVPWSVDRSNAGLLFYFVLIVQLSDIAQYAWGALLGKHVIAPAINSSRTWEGFGGAIATAALTGILFHWATPFGIWESSCMAMAIAVVGFSGRMVMSAIKRDRGVNDTGTLVTGHSGVLDRIDSICFAAPVFFHLTRFFYEQPFIR